MTRPPERPSPAGVVHPADIPDIFGDAADPFAPIRHDLRTPLAVTAGHAQLLRRDVHRLPGLTDETRDRLAVRADAIEAAARAMAELVDDLGTRQRDPPGRSRDP